MYGNKTAQPVGLCCILSGKRGSNSRPEAWEASTLPTELLPHVYHFSCEKCCKDNEIFRLRKMRGGEICQN